MHILCVIRYQIDPFRRDDFERYAAAWGTIIPRCGGKLMGYFVPYEGTNDIAWGMVAFESLASYEEYRTRLKSDAAAQANFAMAETRRVILREERTFVHAVAGTFHDFTRTSPFQNSAGVTAAVRDINSVTVAPSFL